MWEDGKAGGRRAIAKNNNIAITNTDIEGKDSVNFKLRVDSMDRANSTDSANFLILILLILRIRIFSSIFSSSI